MIVTSPLPVFIDRRYAISAYINTLLSIFWGGSEHCVGAETSMFILFLCCRVYVSVYHTCLWLSRVGEVILQIGAQDIPPRIPFQYLALCTCSCCQLHPRSADLGCQGVLHFTIASLSAFSLTHAIIYEGNYSDRAQRDKTVGQGGPSCIICLTLESRGKQAQSLYLGCRFQVIPQNVLVDLVIEWLSEPFCSVGGAEIFKS